MLSKWLAAIQIGGSTSAGDFAPTLNKIVAAISRLKNVSNVRVSVCLCIRANVCVQFGGWFSGVTFRNDTAAAEDLQQVVFKFPEFNKLLSPARLSIPIRK